MIQRDDSRGLQFGVLAAADRVFQHFLTLKLPHLRLRQRFPLACELRVGPRNLIPRQRPQPDSLARVVVELLRNVERPLGCLHQFLRAH